MSDFQRVFSLTRSDGSSFTVTAERGDDGRDHFEWQEGPEREYAQKQATEEYLAGTRETPSLFESGAPSDRYFQELNQTFKAAGAGDFNQQISSFMTGFDRSMVNFAPAPTAHTGFTFITRPYLPLESINLRQDTTFFPLDTFNPTSLGFAIRCLLDTRFATTATAGGSLLATRSPFYNPYCAFNLPLCNALQSCTGWPDPATQLYTSPDGFFGENQTTVGSPDWLNGTYELSLAFKDIEFNPIFNILYYWHRCMMHLIYGTMVAYPRCIDDQELPYTTSIYRFVVDPTRKFIIHNARAVGCFPGATVPIGDLFNANANEVFTTAGHQFTVPFTANAVRYKSPDDFHDFNTLVKRYAPDIETWEEVPDGAYWNYNGIPWIDLTQGTEPQLTFRAPRLDGQGVSGGSH